MNLILLGAPGAGKGTQAELLSKQLGIPTISTGNILRDAMKRGTELGRKVKDLMDNGQLVPDDVVIGIVEERVHREDCAKGFILDGMPRTIPQAIALEERGIHVDAAVSIELADHVIEERMSGRRVCSGCGASYHVEANPPKTEGICDNCGHELVVRKDDTAETVRSRLKVFHSETEPLKHFYADHGVLKLINGAQTIEEANRDILEALGRSYDTNQK